MNAPHENPAPPDDLDRLLKRWHEANAARAAAGRDALMARVRQQPRRRDEKASPSLAEALAAFAGLLRRALVNRYSPVAAALAAAVVLVALLLPGPRGELRAGVCYAPEGGRLDALDEQGNVLGPCALKHTDVQAEISGPFSRVTVRQSYHNGFPRTIEAVYTFPLGRRGSVDRMTMTIGDRVVIGEVHERSQARRIYEQAKNDRYAAGLLEQERPNVFRHSVANIEPGADVIVEIGYVDVLEVSEGTYRFDFPMVVGPRYIPGVPSGKAALPAGLTGRSGLVLLGPADFTAGAAGDAAGRGTLQAGRLRRIIETAVPIEGPGDARRGAGDATGGAGQPALRHRFESQYTDGSREFGELYADGTGQLNGRWFYCDPEVVASPGTGFADGTDQVPDAGRVTPQPVKPAGRSGHDVSVRVAIDTGGPAIDSVSTPLHETLRRREGPSKLTVELARKAEIPNRDFVLSWKTSGEAISEASFVHADPRLGEGFFSVVLQPPARVADDEVQPRELVFVMDVSGSMDGFPIEKSKAVMTRVIDAMRPADTFNVVTFSGGAAVLWDRPQPATPENVESAKAFVDAQRGGGGTEMLAAIELALAQAPFRAAGFRGGGGGEGAGAAGAAGGAGGALAPAALAGLPADGRPVAVDVPYRAILQTLQADPAIQSWVIRLRDDLTAPLFLKQGASIPPVFQPEGVTLRISGRWVTQGGRSVLVAESIGPAPGDAARGGGAAAPAALRIGLVLTDGQVGNDLAVIDAVRQQAGATRVFCFGIGNAVNRFLIDGLARAGRGESEVILLPSDADDAVARFARRIRTPVLSGVELAFSGGLDVTGTIPPAGAIPDLFDERPLVIQGRYGAPGEGTLTVRGRTARGPWERSIGLKLPAESPAHGVIAPIWARARVDEILAPHLAAVQQGSPPPDVKAAVVAIGEQFRIMTPYTGFVAVEKSRMTLDGKPVLVSVPVEMPEGESPEGVFGEREDLDADMVSFQRAQELLHLGFDAPEPAPALMARSAGTDIGRTVDEIAASRTAPAVKESIGQASGKRSVMPRREAGPPSTAAAPAAPPPSTPAEKARDVNADRAGEAAQEHAKKDQEVHEVTDSFAARQSVAGEARDAGGDGKLLELEGALAGEPQVSASDDRATLAGRLRRVLEPGLIPTVSSLDKSAGPLRVTVLLARVDDGVLEVLRASGLAVEGSSRSARIVVGRIAAADLEKLALLEVVRRIERTRMVPAN